MSTICSAVKVSGAPGRGASASTRAIRRLRSAASCSTAASCLWAAAQRARHLMTVLGVQPRSWARGTLRMPVAAAKTMRTRKAMIWGVECWRSSASSTACCGGLTVMGSGSGPAKRYPPLVQSKASERFPHPMILPELCTLFRRAVLACQATHRVQKTGGCPGYRTHRAPIVTLQLSCIDAQKH
jgi:hypothetical protein